MHNSRLYKTQVTHIRKKPSLNKFKYNFYHFLLDLDEIKSIHEISRLMAYEKFAPLSFFEKDHLKYDLENTNLSIKERVKNYLKENKMKFSPQKIFLLTHLRIFKYIFNPVSFYYCFDVKEKLRVVIAEVNNTFSEQKTYLIDLQKPKNNAQKKKFYVSPFIHNNCNFEFNVKTPGETIFAGVNSRDEKTNEMILNAHLKGSHLELNTRNLIKLNLKYPFVTFKVIFLIHWQALKLFLKRVPYFKKENPASK